MEENTESVASSNLSPSHGDTTAGVRSMNVVTIFMKEVLTTLSCSTITLSDWFRSKEHVSRGGETTSDGGPSVKKEGVEVVAVNSPILREVVPEGITLEYPWEGEAQKVILGKPNPEMTRHIKPLYVKAHLNGKPVTKVLIDNGSTVNIMPLRMLKLLGRSVEDLINIEVTIAAFTGAIS